MIELFRPDWTRPPEGVDSFVSTRSGGVSEGRYRSLNLSYSVGDEEARVIENRRRFAAHAGFSPSRVVLPALVHGVEVRPVSPADGVSLEARPAWRSDGLLTGDADLTLLVTIADCVPVFLASADGRWISLLHAGWRGVIGGIAGRSARALLERGVPADEIRVAIGPSIGACCFEVDAALAARFAKTFGPETLVSPRRVDLRRALERDLARVGCEVTIPPAPCTRCAESRFFSHRGAGGVPAGRLLAGLRRI